MQAKIVIALLRNRQVQGALVACVLLVVMMPVIVAAGVTGLLAQEAASACLSGSIGAASKRLNELGGHRAHQDPCQWDVHGGGA
ncbi:MAG TPA: hypothetical protein VFV03_06835 [Solirubrobacteraceae bacterium]|nr:hypothetical protein [Solirubrobacteraceae bacterium]